MNKQSSYSDSGLEKRIELLSRRAKAMMVEEPGGSEIQVLKDCRKELQEYDVRKANRTAKSIDKYFRRITKQVDSEHKSINRYLYLSDKLPPISAKLRMRKFQDLAVRWLYIERLRESVAGENIYFDSGMLMGLANAVYVNNKLAKKRSIRIRTAVKTAVIASMLSGAVYVYNQIPESPPYKETVIHVEEDSSPPTVTYVKPEPIVEDIVQEKSVNPYEELHSEFERKIQNTISYLENPTSHKQFEKEKRYLEYYERMLNKGLLHYDSHKSDSLLSILADYKEIKPNYTNLILESVLDKRYENYIKSAN